jgi:hypothetical protein
MARALCLLVCFGCALSPLESRAQDSPFVFQQGAFANLMAIPSMMERLERSHRTIFGQSVEESLKGSRSRGSFKPSSLLPSSTVLKGEATGAFASNLSFAYPAANRPEAERVFRDLLARYGKIEQQFGIPHHDVAGSVAAFLAGSWMAYRNTDFPDERFKPLVNQMRQILGSNPEFANASNADKQEMYEQMAILGMLMAGTQMALKEKPNPQIAANMKQAAKGYLEQFLKTDAERVQITAQGLVLK